MKALFFVVMALFAILAVVGILLSGFRRLARKKRPAKKSRALLPGP
jgi:flagellar biogenesis protein FliO